MNVIRKTAFMGILFLAALTGCNKVSKNEVREDFATYFKDFNVNGSFVLYEEQKDKYAFFNEKQFKQAFLPASTFKICNALIGLETGVIKDENFVIPWDGINRSLEKWNSDHDLKTAYKNSTVWYYQELARRVGNQKMKYWLDKAKYGNADTSGGIDKFWLTGGLTITPEQQINFLKRLRNNQLPFSKRSVDIVKNIMIARDTLDYVIRAKTGWAIEEKRMVGWYVGYVEKGNNTYYFSTCIQTPDLKHPDFVKARIDITNKILKDLRVVK